jgi:LuxR family transcriptional regulator, maltose regulon positive regulatory protein
MGGAGDRSGTGRRRRQYQVILRIVRLLHARQRGDVDAAAQEARQLQAQAESPEAVQPHLGEDLHALALISLGNTEVWATRFDDAYRHLEQGVLLVRRVGRPFLEFTIASCSAA